MNNTVAPQLTLLLLSDLRKQSLLFSLDQPLNSGQLFPKDDLILLHQSFKGFQWPPCSLQASGALYYQVSMMLQSDVFEA
ncbi:hypothetical protein ACFX1R_047702 [Malus domestica]